MENLLLLPPGFLDLPIPKPFHLEALTVELRAKCQYHIIGVTIPQLDS
jgi:hypothetical protein